MPVVDRHGPFPGGLSIQSEVVSDFDIGQTPAGRTLGYRFPSSGILTFEPLRDEEVSTLQPSSGLTATILSPNGSCFVDALSEDRTLEIIHVHRHGRDGLLINLDGAFGFLSFKPTTPNTVQKPHRRNFLRKVYKYKFRTSIDADETSRCLLDSNKHLLDCVNLCLVDYQLGSTYKYHRNGKLELVHGPKPPRHPRLRKLASNILDPTKTMLDVAAEATSSFPPASAIIKGLLAAHAVKKVSTDHRAEAQSELERADELYRTAEKLIRDAQGNQQKDIECGARPIIATCGDIKHTLLPIIESNLFTRISRLNRNKDAIQEARRKLDAAERTLMNLKDSYLVASVGHLLVKQHTSEPLVTVAELAEMQRLYKHSISLSVALF